MHARSAVAPRLRLRLSSTINRRRASYRTIAHVVAHMPPTLAGSTPTQLKERGGSSLAAIKKYLTANAGMDFEAGKVRARARSRLHVWDPYLRSPTVPLITPPHPAPFPPHLPRPPSPSFAPLHCPPPPG